MTLCIAAICTDWGDGLRVVTAKGNSIVVCADRRTEASIASGDNTFKYEWLIESALWAMFADNVSKAREFCATCRTAFAGVEAVSNQDELFTKLNEASAAHRRKLCDQLAQRRFGMTYQHVCENGAAELPENTRLRFFHEIEEINFDCELIVFGFAGGKGRLFYIDRDGEVESEDNFAAIGSGSSVAEGNLYFRQQSRESTPGETLYAVYESARLAYEAKAPGVGETKYFYLFTPTADDQFQASRLSSGGEAKLEACWKKYAPRKINQDIGWRADYLDKIEVEQESQEDDAAKEADSQESEKGDEPD